MALELYVFPPSPRAFKTMVVANHLGLDYSLRFVDLLKGEQKTPEFAALNPNMRMPVVKDGDFVLWEANAIMQYLASLKPESGLYPSSEHARLDVNRWLFWDLAHWDPTCSVFAFENLLKALLGMGEPDPVALAKGTDNFHRIAKVLDGQLKGRKFVTGDTLTLADFAIASALILTERARTPVEGYAEIGGWFERLQALPAWQKTLAQQTPPVAAAA